jgi:hypothetical protein
MVVKGFITLAPGHRKTIPKMNFWISLCEQQPIVGGVHPKNKDSDSQKHLTIILR